MPTIANDVWPRDYGWHFSEKYAAYRNRIFRMSGRKRELLQLLLDDPYGLGFVPIDDLYQSIWRDGERQNVSQTRYHLNALLQSEFSLPVGECAVWSLYLPPSKSGEKTIHVYQLHDFFLSSATGGATTSVIELQVGVDL